MSETAAASRHHALLEDRRQRPLGPTARVQRVGRGAAFSKLGPFGRQGRSRRRRFYPVGGRRLSNAIVPPPATRTAPTTTKSHAALGAATVIIVAPSAAAQTPSMPATRRPSNKKTNKPMNGGSPGRQGSPKRNRGRRPLPFRSVILITPNYASAHLGGVRPRRTVPGRSGAKLEVSRHRNSANRSVPAAVAKGRVPPSAGGPLSKLGRAACRPSQEGSTIRAAVGAVARTSSRPR